MNELNNISEGAPNVPPTFSNLVISQITSIVGDLNKLPNDFEEAQNRPVRSETKKTIVDTVKRAAERVLLTDDDKNVIGTKNPMKITLDFFAFMSTEASSPTFDREALEYIGGFTEEGDKLTTEQIERLIEISARIGYFDKVKDKPGKFEMKNPDLHKIFFNTLTDEEPQGQ